MRDDGIVNWTGVSFAHPTESKIWSFRNLRAGWHCDEGVEFSDHDLRLAINLHSEIVGAGFLETDAFPGLGGEVRVTLYLGDFYAEFTLEKHGKWTFLREQGNDEKDYKEFLSFEEVVSIIKLLPDFMRRIRVLRR